jgi:hypothetical protein
MEKMRTWDRGSMHGEKEKNLKKKKIREERRVIRKKKELWGKGLH